MQITTLYLSDDNFRRLRSYCVNHKKSIKEVVNTLIKENLKLKQPNRGKTNDGNTKRI